MIAVIGTHTVGVGLSQPFVLPPAAAPGVPMQRSEHALLIGGEAATPRVFVLDTDQAIQAVGAKDWQHRGHLLPPLHSKVAEQLGLHVSLESSGKRPGSCVPRIALTRF
jgi:hypothetical protein